MRSLAISIILHESIKTTLAKAKEIRGFLEPLVTLAKENNVANQRKAYAKLRDKAAVAKLFNDCLLYTSPSPRDLSTSRMPSSA